MSKDVAAPVKLTQGKVAAIDNKATLDTPLDYSFMSFTECIDLREQPPREPIDNKKRKLHHSEINLADGARYNAKCIRLNNNGIKDIKDLVEGLSFVIIEPTCITWLDLSFNDIGKIDPILCDLQNLMILYLHGNNVDDIREVDKLAGLPHLTKLSLHGNPIERVKNYRWYVLSHVPGLKNFDMSAITKADRATAATWKTNNPKGKSKKSKSCD